MFLRLICILFFFLLFFSELAPNPDPYHMGPDFQGGLRLVFYVYLLVTIDRLSRKIERLENAKINQLGKRISSQIEDEENVSQHPQYHPQHWEEDWKKISQLKEKE